MKSSRYKLWVVSFCIILNYPGVIFSQMKWEVFIGKKLSADPAIKLALNDLVYIGETYGLTFKILKDDKNLSTHTILIGTPDRNSVTAELVKNGKITCDGVEDPQGFEIITITSDNGKILVVAGGSIIGDVNGIYWIWDRLRVFGELPEINVKREPALKIRYTRIPANKKEDLHRALRYGLNLVYVRDPLSLVPWPTEPEKTQNIKNREKINELITYAHSLHMKVLTFGTDFTYHPSLLDEHQATLSACDPRFWQAVQAKYRRLLKAMPMLDGVATFTGEEQSYWGNYLTFDPMHETGECDISLATRYRTFIKKIYEVVVGEFGKIYHHRTWNTNCYEQQSRYEVYRKIFTPDVPVKNLYLIPSFTQNDRWWHQRYNPTFNITPHQMLAVLEPMNYYESSKSNLFATFPGQYFQAGLQTVLEQPNSNLMGVSFDLHPGDDYNTYGLTAYTVFRLEWDYLENPRTIAEDFCSIHFGRKKADKMAEIYLLSPTAYKYGLFIEPVAYGEFNSLPHIRVGTFPAQGYPSIDNGKEHMAFLRKIYLRCKPWISETMMYLDHGLNIANIMREKFEKVKSEIADKEKAMDLESRLQMTYLFIKTNNLYVKTAFEYFNYRNNPTGENKNNLVNLFTQLENTRAAFMETPKFGYKLFGINQLLKNVKQSLDNLANAEEQLSRAPNISEIEKAIVEQQAKYKKALTKFGNECVKILSWEGRVDGRDILKIRGDQIEVEHLRWDPIYFKESTFLNPLPKKEVTVIPNDIKSRPMHPFILEQPTAGNDYTVKVYLYDVPGGAGWCKFDLYYISKSPEELGLNIPWTE
jgi:hypothetical protein